MLAFAIPYHEPWADEAQAWMLARSLSPWQLIHTHLRYEGSPALWHLLLWALIRLRISYAGMHWVCGGIALAGVSVLVFRSPFPRYLKLLLPFTYFLAFQYAVVARSYVLIPVLLFSIAVLWKRNALILALLVGLLANTEGHAFFISLGLALAYLIEHRSYAGRLVLPGIVLAALYGFAVYTAFPPHDLWIASYHAPNTQIQTPATKFIVRAILSLSWGLCEPLVLFLPFWIVMVGLLYHRKQRRFLLPVLFMVVFSGAVYLNFWHAGLMVPLLLTILWITWPTDAPQRRRSRWELAGTIALLCVALTQIGWTICAISYDHSHAYSPGEETARYLAPYIAAGDKAAVTYLRDSGIQAFGSVGIAPYFSHPIFMNQPTPFWQWSTHNRTEANFYIALRTHPSIVVLEYHELRPFDPSRDLRNAKVELLNRNGYSLTKTFCATMPERFQIRETFCNLIFLQSPTGLYPLGNH